MTEAEDYGLLDQTYEIERKEWAQLSIALRQHGFMGVDVIHPRRISHLSEIVLLSTNTAHCIRHSLTTLMLDCDRRQELVQEMIITNNQLREELKAQTQTAARFENELAKVKSMLAESNRVKQAICDSQLEMSSSHLSDTSFVANRFGNIQLQTKCEQLQQKCDLFEKEVKRLSEKNERFIMEEEKRRQREADVLERLQKKPGRERIDDVVLNIIDAYERQIFHLQRTVDGDKDLTALSQSIASSVDTCTPNFKALIRTYEKNLTETKKKLKAVENECETVKLELHARPQLKDLREAQLKVKQLERLVKNLKAEKLSSSLDASSVHDGRSLVCDIDFMSPPTCRKYLKLFCDELGVVDLEHVVAKLRKMAGGAEALPQLELFAKEVLRVVNGSDLPRPPEVATTSASLAEHEVWCEKTWSRVVPILEFWSIQLRNLKELHASIKRMIDHLFPWYPIKSKTNSVTTVELIRIIDSLVLDNASTHVEVKGLPAGTEQETQAMLRGVVTHFQKLFDVPNFVGIYPRMSDIYRKLSETNNVMLTLKDYLGLDESAKSHVVVEAVAHLCTIRNTDIEERLAELLQVDDSSSIIAKIRDYQEFFTVFHSTMQELLSILGVQSVDAVVPKVRLLLRSG